MLGDRKTIDSRVCDSVDVYTMPHGPNLKGYRVINNQLCC